MKLTTLSIIILLVLLSSGIQSHSQSSLRQESVIIQNAKSQEITIQQLQDIFRKVDKEAGLDPDVYLMGQSESSAKLTIVTGFVGMAVGSKEVGYQFDLSLVTIPEDILSNIIIAVFSRTDSSGSLEGVKVRQIGSTANYEVVEDYTYQTKNYKVTVPKGFVYDRASIPRIFWVIIDKDSLSNVAPLFHDLLYRNGGKLGEKLVSPYRTFTREDTDELFLELMTKCGVQPWRRRAAYQAVRQFAKSSWKGN